LNIVGSFVSVVVNRYTRTEPSGKNEKKWVPVDDVISLTPQREKQKQKVAKLSKRKKNQHYKNYHIAMRKDDYVEAIEDQGDKIVFSIPQ